MSDCCPTISADHATQAKALRIVLAINLAMFFIEVVSGFVANSTALLADSLDMLGDAAVYALALYVVHRGSSWKAGSALTKGIVMAIFGVGVLIDAYFRLKTESLPSVSMIGGVGTLAILANLACALILLKHRNDDINMRSTWRCTRNDVIANAATLLGALMVYLINSRWPDAIVGVSIAVLVLVSAQRTISESVRELRPNDVRRT